MVRISDRTAFPPTTLAQTAATQYVVVGDDASPNDDGRAIYLPVLAAYAAQGGVLPALTSADAGDILRVNAAGTALEKVNLTTRGRLIATLAFPPAGITAANVPGSTWPAGTATTLAADSDDAENGAWSANATSGGYAGGITRANPVRYRASMTGVDVVAKVAGAIVHEATMWWGRPEDNPNTDENPFDLMVSDGLFLKVVQNIRATAPFGAYSINIQNKAFGTGALAASATVEFYEAGLFLTPA